METLNCYNINLKNTYAIDEKLELFYDIDKFSFDLQNINSFYDVDTILKYLVKVIPENSLFLFDILEVNNQYIVDFRNKMLLNEFENGDSCIWHNYIIHNTGNGKLVFRDNIEGILYDKNNSKKDGFEPFFIPEPYIESFENNLFCTVEELDKVGFRKKVDASIKTMNNFVNDIVYKEFK